MATENVVPTRGHLPWKMTELELPYKTARDQGSNPGHSNGSSSINPVDNGSIAFSTASNLGMDKSTLKVHLPDGSFNVVRFGDATDIKVSKFLSTSHQPSKCLEISKIGPFCFRFE